MSREWKPGDKVLVPATVSRNVFDASGQVTVRFKEGGESVTVPATGLIANERGQQMPTYATACALPRVIGMTDDGRPAPTDMYFGTKRYAPAREPMTEDERLQRARQAVADDALYAGPTNARIRTEIRAGKHDGVHSVRVALAVLRNLDTPLPEPVDPDVLACREALIQTMPHRAKEIREGAFDDKPVFPSVLAAYRAGKGAATNAR